MPRLRCAAGRCCFFFQAEDGIRDRTVTEVQTCALPISSVPPWCGSSRGRAHFRFLRSSLFSFRVSSSTTLSNSSKRSEERRVGKECRFGWAPEHEKESKRENETEVYKISM